MDRRQRKTREAIFSAFSSLAAEKDFMHITVGEIIERADVGRATFYAHFETKEFLLREFCHELFCHIFDTAEENCSHRHIFDCCAEDKVFLHLFRHLMQNDNNILTLLFSENNELFIAYFKRELEALVLRSTFEIKFDKEAAVPQELWKSYVVSAFTETLRFWYDGGRKDSPETVYRYFIKLIQ